MVSTRVTLDVTGTLPTAQEVKNFSPARILKRRKRYNSGRPAYAAWWATKLNIFRQQPATNPASHHRDVISAATGTIGVQACTDANRTTRLGHRAGLWSVQPGSIHHRYMKSSISGEQSKDFAERKDMPVVLGRRTFVSPRRKRWPSHSFLGVRIQCLVSKASLIGLRADFNCSRPSSTMGSQTSLGRQQLPRSLPSCVS